MTWSNRLRVAAFSRLPRAWRPAATYEYHRLRSHLEPELPLICRHLQPGSCAVDVGANEGVYTHAFAKTGSSVEAFEPLPSCLAVLRAYAAAHPGVRVHGEALGDVPGVATLRVPMRDGRAVAGWATLRGDLPGEAGFEVPVRTLDSLALPRVDVIKIDVEGTEGAVIRGARETIAAHRPVLLVEIEQRHLAVPIRQAFEEILDLGYSGEFLDPDGGIRPLRDFRVQEHQVAANADVPGAPYVNNFFFRPSPGARRDSPVPAS